MLKNKFPILAALFLLFVFATSCRNQESIAKQNQQTKEKERTEQSTRQEQTKEQKVNVEVEVEEDIQQDSEITIIKYDNDKPPNADGERLVKEKIIIKKTGSQKIKSRQNSSEEKTEGITTTGKSQVESSVNNKVQTEESQQRKAPTKTIVLKFIVLAALACLLIYSKKTKAVMGITQWIRNLISLMRKK